MPPACLADLQLVLLGPVRHRQLAAALGEHGAGVEGGKRGNDKGEALVWTGQHEAYTAGKQHARCAHRLASQALTASAAHQARVQLAWLVMHCKVMDDRAEDVQPRADRRWWCLTVRFLT